MLRCGTCEKFYIGQTGRTFNKRYKEHLPKGNLANITSNFARHLVEMNHDYENFDTDCTPLHICRKGRVMDTLEEYEIYRAHKLHSNNILNDKLCFTINTLYDLAMNSDAQVSRKRN